jgi:osmotically-inducible protein OsmY
MKFKKRSQSSAIVLALALSVSWVAPSRAQSATSQAQPDNTKVNKRDKNPDEATADQQKMNAADRNLTARIRKSVMADKTLSTYAHNVKIISQNGIVTLKGQFVQTTKLHDWFGDGQCAFAVHYQSPLGLNELSRAG